MKELTNINFCTVEEKGTELAKLEQCQSQYDNMSAALWQYGKARLFHEDLGNGSNTYLLDADERREDPVSFVQDCVSEWAGYPDDNQLERYRWGLDNPADDVYTGDGECKILVVDIFHGYTPTYWLTVELAEEWSHDNDSIATFPNSAAAQVWIDEQRKGPYYLSHNELESPDYYIIQA